MSDQQKTASLMSLALHFPKSGRTDREQAIWLSDYLSDLRPHTAEAVEFACRSWRASTAKAFPRVGDLLPAVAKLGPSKGFDHGGAWKPLTDDQYRELPLAEKVRYHRISAIRAEFRAGPQAKDKRGVPPEEMPEPWHRFKNIAVNHRAESGRLADKLRQSIEREATA